MSYMKYLKKIKIYYKDIVYVSLILIFIYIYMIVYMTSSRKQLYQYNTNQITIIFHELTNIGR